MSLVDEIHEQPAVLEAAIGDLDGPAAEAVSILRRPDVHHAVIAARGTSDNAARYATYAWGALGGVAVTLAAPSLHTLYRSPPRLDGAAVVAFSQSGQSPDLAAVLGDGRRAGRPTIAVVNDTASPLATIADVVVPINAGEERSVAATKSYTATLAAVARIAAGLAGDRARDDELAAVPGQVATVLGAADPEILVGELGPLDHAVVLGRGYNRATAFEWALKLQEMAYLPAHPFSTADFAHGPFAVLEPGFPVLAVVPRGAAYDDGVAALERIAAETTARIVVIGNGELAHPTIRIPGGPEWLTPITAIVAAQLFSVAVATSRGIDPDEPRGLTKVTRTR